MYDKLIFQTSFISFLKPIQFLKISHPKRCVFRFKREDFDISMNGVWMVSATSARKEQKHLDRRLANWKNLDERSSNKTWLSARLSSWNENGLARVSTARNKSRRGVDSIRPRGVQGVRERSIDGENGAREAVGWSANAKGSVNARTYIYIYI